MSNVSIANALWTTCKLNCCSFQEFFSPCGEGLNRGIARRKPETLDFKAVQCLKIGLPFQKANLC